MIMACCRKESKMPQKVALCQKEANKDLSFRQKTRAEGIPNNPRTIPEAFLMYQNVSTIMTIKTWYVMYKAYRYKAGSINLL